MNEWECVGEPDANDCSSLTFGCFDYALNGSQCLRQMSEGLTAGQPLNTMTQNRQRAKKMHWKKWRAKKWGSLFILPGLALFSGVTLKSNHLRHHRNRSFLFFFLSFPLIVCDRESVCVNMREQWGTAEGSDIKIGSRKGFNEEALWTFFPFLL